MRRFFPLFLVVAGCSRTEPQDVTVAKSQIWEAMRKYYAAQIKGDIDAMEKMITPDCSIRRAESFAHNKDEVIEAWKAMVAENKRVGVEGKRDITYGKEFIDVVRDVAVVTFTCNANDPKETLKGMVTAVFRRQDGTWLIAHLHETWEKK